MPLASAAAALVGAVIMFWHRLVGATRGAVRRARDAFSRDGASRDGRIPVEVPDPDRPRAGKGRRGRRGRRL